MNIFFLLLYKNFVLIFRRPFSFIFQTVAVFVCACYVTTIYKKGESEGAIKIYEELDILDFDNPPKKWFEPHYFDIFNRHLLYTPNTSEISTIMNCFKYFYPTMGFKNEQDLEQYYKFHEKHTFAALQFDPKGFKEKIKLKIRFPNRLQYINKDEWSYNDVDNWMTNKFEPLIKGERSFQSAYGAYPNYYLEGFLEIQYLATFFIMNRNLAKTTCEAESNNSVMNLIDTRITIKRFSHKKTIYENYTGVFLFMLIGLIIFIFFLCFINVAIYVIEERQSRLKEFLVAMGCPVWSYWFSWFLFYFLIYMMYVLLLAAALTLAEIFYNADKALLLVFLILYSTASLSFALAISSCFSQTNYAIIIGTIIWIGTYIIYWFIRKYEEVQQTDNIGVVKTILCLIANMALGFGFETFIKYEGEKGAQWSNIDKDKDFNLQTIIIMLAFDSLLYTLIAVLTNKIFPDKYSSPMPWYFPFTKKYWSLDESNVVVPGDDIQNEPEYSEKVSSKDTVVIQMKNLKKSFKNVVAVNNFSLDLYKNQITVLVGKNGAGKSTVMLMLMGIIMPSGGSITINGFDAKKYPKKARRNIDICLQDNILFDYLTVREHFYMFCRIKGLNDNSADDEVDKYLDRLGLKSMQDKVASKLSGGSKRKLSVGLALCGDSEILLLDEPSSGMDPLSRKQLWNILKEEKNGRTILLITHFMDEADYLADRIAIMSNGRLHCVGSSLFLKEKYDCGYYLKIDKKPQCNPNEITTLIRKYIQNTTIQMDIGSTLSYTLSDKNLQNFEKLLIELENRSQELHIGNFGLSYSTLDELFLKISLQDVTSKTQSPDIGLDGSTSETEEDTSNEQKTSCMNQILAMLLKRMLYIKYRLFLFFFYLMIPFTYLLVIFCLKNFVFYDNLPELLLILNNNNSNNLLEGNDSYTMMYKKLVGNVTIVNDLEEFTKKKINKSSLSNSAEYLIGAKFGTKDADGRDKAISYFNNDPFHTPAISLGYVLNAIAQVKSNLQFEFINYPLPRTKANKAEDAISKFSFSNITTAASIGMIFMSLHFLSSHIKERASNFKTLQYVAGLRVIVFWLASLIMDFLISSVIIGFSVALLCIFQIDGYKTFEEIGRFVLILMVFLLVVLPEMYFFSYCFDNPANGTCLVLVLGGLEFFCAQFPSLYLKHFGVMEYRDIFLLFPFFALSAVLNYSFTVITCMSMYRECINFNVGKENCTFYASIQNCEAVESHGITGHYKFYWISLIEGAVLFFFVLMIDGNLFSTCATALENCFYSPTRSVATVPYYDDKDVLAEEEMIKNTPRDKLLKDYKVVAINLTKFYNRIRAIKCLYFAIKPQECFGLLGMNGAGKTTLLKLMVDELRISLGNLWINRIKINKFYCIPVNNSLGYCPQVNGLVDEFTVEETLIIFALIKGYSCKESKNLAVKLAKKYNFFQHFKKKFRELSGGNKRKVSTSVAMMGQPQVIILDEPTAGVDVLAKRSIWSILNKVRNQGRCIILATNSMDECDAICNRAVMISNGEFACFGSVQYLKNKFATGYEFSFKFKDGSQSTQDLEEYVKSTIPQAKLHSKDADKISYSVSDKDIKISKLFALLEKTKAKNANIEYYFIRQRSLQQVFMTLT